MVYILASDGRQEDVERSFRRYRDYLESVRHSFPISAYQLATSEWYYNFEDRRCPHDSWLESCTLSEPSSGRQGGERILSLSVRLLGAYHDRYIELRYPRVFSYRLNIDDGLSGQRDWRYDEFRLSERGHLLHEIEWRGLNPTGSWVIEASDIEIDWVPRNAAQKVGTAPMMRTENLDDRSRLLLSVNRALWGEVSANMRGVLARVDGYTILLRVYFDGEPSSQDRDSISCAGTEVIADFPDEYGIEEEIIRLDAPKRLPADPSWMTIYRRRESHS